MFHSVMKLATTCAVLSMLFVLASSASAFTSENHSVTVCSELDPAVCAHLGLPEKLSASGKTRFIAHILTKDDMPVSNVKVKLWMPDMGHGTSPVKVEAREKNHFLVSNAYFVMAGTWLVKIDFEFANSSHHLEIPVEIGE